MGQEGLFLWGVIRGRLGEPFNHPEFLETLLIAPLGFTRSLIANLIPIFQYLATVARYLPRWIKSKIRTGFCTCLF